MKSKSAMTSATKGTTKNRPVKCKIADIPVAVPVRKTESELSNTKIKGLYTIEDTGLGDDLCIDVFFGRVFLSDAGVVKDVLENFSKEYQLMCLNADEDPDNIMNAPEILSYNDLYERLNLGGTMVGYGYGWPTAADYRYSSIDWEERWIINGYYPSIYGRPVYIFAPRDYAVPMEGYMEVS